MKKYKELESGFKEYAERVEMVMNKFDEHRLNEMADKILNEIENKDWQNLNKTDHKISLLSQHHRLWRK